MNTTPEQSGEGRRGRRLHSDEFKANAVASCMQPGISMAAVAMANGINANLLCRWVQTAEMRPGSALPDAPPMAKRQVGGKHACSLRADAATRQGFSERHPHRIASRHDLNLHDMAHRCRQRVCGLGTRAASMIRIDALWLAVDLVDMWLRLERTRVADGRGIAVALNYSLKRWEALGRFLHDGEVSIDNNHVERLMRPWAMGRNKANSALMRSRHGAVVSAALPAFAASV